MAAKCSVWFPLARAGVEAAVAWQEPHAPVVGTPHTGAVTADAPLPLPWQATVAQEVPAAGATFENSTSFRALTCVPPESRAAGRRVVESLTVAAWQVTQP